MIGTLLIFCLSMNGKLGDRLVLTFKSDVTCEQPTKISRQAMKRLRTAPIN